MRYREDGSYSSANNPIDENRYAVLDNGLYIAQIIDIAYTDSISNNTLDANGPQTLYKIRVIGGRRDGQIFDNATDMQLFGGITNNSERGWKKATTLLRLDPANIFNPVPEPILNGDVVYIQFINGDIHYPIIIGGAKHANDVTSGATSSEGQIFRTSFNGVSTEIDKDGVFTWTKAKGEYFPFPTINIEGQRLWDQFVPILGFEEAFKLTMDNELDLTFGISPTPATSIEINLNGANDTFSVTNLTGASITLDGISDSFEYKTAGGASVSISGLEDTIELSTTLGAKATISGTSGIKLKDAIGAELNLADGLVALGNGSAELLDLFSQCLSQLITLTQALSIEAPAGFGAILVGAPTYAAVNVQITAINTLLTAIKGTL